MDYIKLKADYDSLFRRYEELGKSFVSLTQENDQLRVQNNLLTEKNKQLINSKSSSEGIIHSQITRMNEKNNEYLEEIRDLKEELRKRKK